MKALEELNIPLKLRKLIHLTLKSTNSNVQKQYEKPDYCQINIGVREEDTLSATLFIPTLEYILRNINNGPIRT